MQNPQTGTGAIAASTVPFSGVTSGTDANALLVSGSLAPTGTGTITANALALTPAPTDCTAANSAATGIDLNGNATGCAAYDLAGTAAGVLSTFLGTPVTAHTFLGNNTGASASPAFSAIGTSDTSPNWYAADTGGADAAVVTLTPPATALTAGLEVDFLPVAANTTTSPTLNVNSLGAVAITKSGGALAANDLTHTTIAKVIYDGANWELQNPQTSTASAIASGTANQIAYYATTGTVLSGTNTLPSGTLAITQTAGDTTTDVATDAFAQNAATTAQSAAITAAETYANTEYIQALSGDLSGTLPGPVTVVGINGSPLGATTGAASGAVLEYNGTNWAPSTAITGVGVPWSSLTAPTTNLSLAMGTDTTSFTWATQASPATSDWTFTAAADTGASTTPIYSFTDTTGNARTGPLFNINTASGSTALPLQVTAQGAANGVAMDATGDLEAIGSGAITATTATALAATPTGCVLPLVATGIDANGNAICSEPSNVTGNAATATSLVGPTTDCPAGQAATGINTLGVAQGCTAYLATLPATVVQTNQANTYTTGAQNFAAATSLQVPTSAGAAPTTAGQVAYNSTTNQLVANINGAVRNIGNNTRTICYIAGGDNPSLAPALTASDSQQGYAANMIGPLTITGASCQVNKGSVTFVINKNVSGAITAVTSSVACTTASGWQSVSLSGTPALAFSGTLPPTDQLDLSITATSGSATRLSVCLQATVN